MCCMPQRKAEEAETMRINKTGPTFGQVYCQPIKDRHMPLFKQACQPIKEGLAVRDRNYPETVKAIDEMNKASFIHKYQMFTATIIGAGLGVLGTTLFRSV